MNHHTAVGFNGHSLSAFNGGFCLLEVLNGALSASQAFNGALSASRTRSILRLKKLIITQLWLLMGLFCLL